jgi:preprotein translocase subunit SecF
MILPIILLIFSITVLTTHYIQTGDMISRGVSLKGGTTLTVAQPISVDEISSFLIQKFPNSEINVRSLTSAGKHAGVIIEASDITSDDLLKSVEEKTGVLDKNQYTIDTTGPSLGESFFKQTIISVIVAFVLMSLVIFLYFRTFLPSFYAIFCAFADMLFAMAIVDVFNIKLTTAGVAAFLMLIGYSIDTDILLTTRVLKRKEGTVAERMAHAIPTGLTMTVASFVAVIVAYFATDSEILKQIMFILAWGLVADVIYTWAFNASLLRMYVESRKEKEEAKQNES